jgi:hypothetical protein
LTPISLCGISRSPRSGVRERTMKERDSGRDGERWNSCSKEESISMLQCLRQIEVVAGKRTVANAGS